MERFYLNHQCTHYLYIFIYNSNILQCKEENRKLKDRKHRTICIYIRSTIQLSNHVWHVNKTYKPDTLYFVSRDLLWITLLVYMFCKK